MELTSEQQYKLCHDLWQKGVSLQITFEQKTTLPGCSGPKVTVDIMSEPNRTTRYDLANGQNVDYLIHKFKLGL